MLRRTGVLAACAIVLAMGAPATGDPPGWRQMKGDPEPAITYEAANGSGIIVNCDNQTWRHIWGIAVYGPAKGLKPSPRMKGKVKGAKNRTVHFKVDLKPDGFVNLLALTSVTRYPDNDAEVFDALSSALKSKSSIIVRVGDFEETFPTTGFVKAMAPLIKTCGDPAKLATKVRQKSEPM